MCNFARICLGEFHLTPYINTETSMQGRTVSQMVWGAPAIAAISLINLRAIFSFEKNIIKISNEIEFKFYFKII